MYDFREKVGPVMLDLADAYLAIDDRTAALNTWQGIITDFEGVLATYVNGKRPKPADRIALECLRDACRKFMDHGGTALSHAKLIGMRRRIDEL